MPHAVQLLNERLLTWAADGDYFAAVLLQAFGTQASTAAAEALRATLLGEGLGLSLKVQSLPGLKGAYAAATATSPERVLLDSQWLAVASVQELEAVLLEELGHAIDQRLNGEVDAPGDEGEIFSALLQGLTPNAGSASESDQHWITVGSEIRLVEAAASSALVTLDVSSILNQDGIINRINGVRDSTQASIDKTGNVLLTQTEAALSVSTPRGLPDDGYFAANAYHPNIQLPYRNSDNGNNVRVLSGSSSFFDLSLTPTTISELHIAALSTEGPSSLRVTYSYSDGTTGSSSISIPDWFDEIAQSSSQYYLIDAMDRASTSFRYEDSNDPALFGFRINPNSGKIVQSLRLEQLSRTGYFVFFGATIVKGFPVVASPGLTSTNGNGTYAPGNEITIQVPFSIAVTVDTAGGIPTLLLETGNTDRTATYSGGSGTNTLSFRYTVQSGDGSVDLDVASSTALQLNGSTIRNAAGDNAVLSLPAPGASGSLAANAALVIDGVAPTISSSTPFDGSTAVSETANVTLSFSELLQAGTGLISLRRADDSLIESFNVANGSGSAGGMVAFSGNTVTINPFVDLASTTAYYLTIDPKAIRDAAGNAYAGISDATTFNFSTGDSISPTISAITSGHAKGTYDPGSLITVAIRFSEPVSVTTSGGVPSLLLETGATDRSATYLTGSGSDTLSFVYTVQQGDISADLDVTSATALSLNGGAITDAAGNNASLTLPNPGAAGSLGTNADVVIRGAASTPLTLINATPVVSEGSRINLALSSETLAPGAKLYWSFSGTGITAADFTSAALAGSLNLGADRRASFSTSIIQDSLVEGDEQLSVSFFSDPARSRLLSQAQVTLRDINPTGTSTDGRDLIIGTTGNDLISGVPRGSLLNGRGSYDSLTGNGGDDVFVLGTASSIYYEDGKPSSSGSSDLAAITDFNTGDRIQLKGAAAHYRLADALVSGKTGSLLYWTKAAGAGTVDEVLGFVQGLSNADLTLTNSSQFLYV